MPAKIMDGKVLADRIICEIGEEIRNNDYKVRLAAIIVGNDKDSITYQRLKENKCKEAGIFYSGYFFLKPKQALVTDKVEELNRRKDVTGIMIQLPLPNGYDENNLLERIKPEKDVEGLNYINIGKSSYDSDVFVPCTASGIMRMLIEYEIPLAGKNAVIIGRGSLVGKPIADLLEKKDVTVTKCHTSTDESRLVKLLGDADIVVSATGQAGTVDSNVLKQGVIAIDCGNTEKNREFTNEIFEKASYMSTVPGGIGPMTIAELLLHLWQAYKKQKGITCKSGF